MEVRYEAAEATWGRVIAARLLPGTDLIEGIEKICKDYSIKYAVISCSVGALEKAVYLGQAPKIGAFSAPHEIPGPVQFLGGQANVCETTEGELETHLHGIVGDPRNRIFGGHFVKGKNHIIPTMELIIMETKGIRMLRKYDEETGDTQFAPTPE